MKIFYFTATGNSLSIAKAIGGELLSIPQEIKKNIEYYEDDVIGIVFPVYGFSQPKIIKKFLKKIKIKAEYTFAIGTYGCMPFKVMNELQKFVQQNGYTFDYVDTILMVDNYLPFFDIEKQTEKIPYKKIEENITRIKKNIENRVIQTDLQYKFSDSIIQAIANRINKYVVADTFAKNFLVNNLCTKCGICVKVCPVNNITINNDVNFDKHCESCLACIHACPNNAIHLKNEKSNTRWLNPNTTLEEIIKSNNI